MESLRKLRHLIEQSPGTLQAKPCYDGRYGVELYLNGLREFIWNDNPFATEDWPELQWEGDFLFHRGHGTVYLVEGQTNCNLNNSIYRSRLRGYQQIVSWATDAKVGFTVDWEVSEMWDWILLSPWLVRSVDNTWLQRLKVFEVLNRHNPELWPMSLLLEHWEEVRKIHF